MQINKLKLKDFKSFSEKEFIFKDVNLISGNNGSGKTTIKDAIFFCLYNKTPHGSSSDTSKYIKNGSDSCVVEIELEIDRNTYTIKRKRSEKSSVVKLLDGSQSEEDSVTTQRELESILPEFALFQNVFNVRYFMSLPDKEKRKFILENTEDVDKKEIFKKIGGTEEFIKDYSLDFDNLDETHKKLLAKKRIAKEEMNKNTILINDSKPTEEVKFDQKKLDKLETEHREMQKEKNLSAKSSYEWSNYNDQLEENERIKKRNQEIKNRIKKITIKDIRKPDVRKLNNIIAKRNEIKKIIELPKGRCPTCLQNIDIKYQDKVDKINNKNIEKAKEIEEEIKQAKKEYNKKNDLYVKNESNKQEINFLKTQISEVNKVVKPSEKIIFDSEKERKLSESIMELKIKKKYADESKKLEEERVKKIDLLKERNLELIKSIGDMTKLINIFSPNGIRSEEMRIKLSPVLKIFNKYIPNSDIKTLQILKNGLSYKEVFQVISDGKEYSKMSLGEKTKVDICISKIIDRICGDKIKTYFIDNSEIIDNLPDIRKQTFVAKVNKSNLTIKTI